MSSFLDITDRQDKTSIIGTRDQLLLLKNTIEEVLDMDLSSRREKEIEDVPSHYGDPYTILIRLRPFTTF